MGRNANNRRVPVPAKPQPNEVRVRWRPPLDIILAVLGLMVSMATLALTSPVLLKYWFPPALYAQNTGSGSGSEIYEISNNGWTSANHTIAEFDAFSEIKHITLRPEAGATIQRADGHFSISYPNINPGEKFTIYIEYSNPEDLASEFGALGMYSLRSDEGAGVIGPQEVESGQPNKH